ncbi:AAA family ATPase [Clostridium paraputrificum]|uniref:AAA family ATPase n=1 Tax=Clostridium TaxID=1485 RepID=UPI00290489E7|nr:AAA family ATPase [Clostridium sp.]MDU1031630.1 AAA family ATPase [Clostridium sp.]
MQYSHSRVETHLSCPYKYKLRYVDKLKTIQAPNADDPLIVGNTIHLGAEKDLQTAIKWYYDNYPIISDRHIEEVMKFEYLIPKIHELLANIYVYKKEFKITHYRFIGIVDLITKNEDGTVDVFDYKYSNNYEKYSESPQLHLYKYFLEEAGFKVRKLGFIFIPKISIKQKKEESLYQFRKRLQEALKNSKIKIMEVKYDASKVIKYMNNIINITEDVEYKKNPSGYCSWCDYEELCIKGEDYMILPSNKRREKKIDKNPDLWIYAQSYVGKSTFIDQYEDLLFLNTDGNTDNTTAPVIPIANKVWYEGRIQKKQFAWEIFLDVITELEKKENDFKRVCIDLVEDLYEHCRLYVYDKYGWEHESDGGYGKGYDLVKTEFLSNMKRLKALGYQIIYISKEVATEVTQKNGNKYTTYKPNIGDKVANVLAGTVDLTIRAYMKGEDRFIQLAKDENVFGGGRFNFKTKTCKLDMSEFTEALIGAQELVGHVSDKVDEPRESRRSRKTEEPKEELPKTKDEEVKEDKSRRSRRTKSEEVGANEETKVEDAVSESKEPVQEEEKPRRRRSRKAE